MTGELFVKILDCHLLAQARVFHLDKWFLVMDNDPKHTSKVAKACCNTNMKKNMFEWPSQSPDINPIENLFAWMNITSKGNVLERKLISKRPLSNFGKV